MEKSTGNKVRLGIFVSLGITLFIVGIYFIGERQQLFSNTFQISAIFKDISGLQIGNNVRYSGINIGIIDGIEQVTDSTVRVDMMINSDTKKFIRKSAQAIIGSDGLMGNKLVIIIPGTASKEEIADNDVIATTRSVSVDDILVKLKVTTDNAADLSDDLSAIVHNIRRGKGTIGKLFMDSAFAQNIDRTIVNLKEGAGGFKQNMDAASHNILLKGFFKKKKNNDEKPKPDTK